MKRLLLFLVIAVLLSAQNIKAQTVIEMMHPDDAHLTLLVVDDIKDADFVVYKTSKKSEFAEFDWMWKFRKGGFSNFTVYLTKNINDPTLEANDEGVKRIVHGKVYFTENKEERGIKTENFHLEGVIVVKRNEDGKKKKRK